MAEEDRILGRWRLTREIGRGGMGQVWLAQRREDTPPDGFPDQAAIKILPSSLGLEPGIALRFQREMEILGRLSHPGIVTFLESTDSRENLGFAMEFVEGCSLQEVLQARGALPWEETVALAIQICLPLKHAHDRGVIHRDLKPSNILVKGWPDSPQVKLTDFGVASLFASRRLTATGGLVGTAETIAPEQVAGKPATKRSDLYSLGVVIDTLISGQFPFRGHLAEVLHKQRFGQHEKLGRLVDLIPFELEKLVDELLAKDPAARPPDAGLVARRLQVIARKDQLAQSDGRRLAPASSQMSEYELPKQGEGPATFVSRVVRAHLEEQIRGGIWSRMMRTPWVVGPMLGLVCVALTWVLWPADPQKILDQGIRLMASTDLHDIEKGWVECLEPLSQKPAGPKPPEGFEKYRAMYEQNCLAITALSRANSADIRSEAEWAYLCAKRLFNEGQIDLSHRVLRAIVIAYRGNRVEKPWVDKSMLDLGGNFASESEQNLITTSEEAIERLRQLTGLGYERFQP